MRFGKIWGRRTFLRSAALLGGGAMVSPFAPLRSLAETGDYPKRLILVYTPNGMACEWWWPNGTETEWALGESLVSLQPYQPKLVFLDGVFKYGMSYQLDGGPGNEHQKGTTMLWTGSKNTVIDGVETSNGRSIDQAVADVIGKDTAFRSREFGIGTGDSWYGNRTIWGGPAQPLSPEENPWAAFESLFAEVSTDPEAQAALARVREQRRSVLDFALDDLDAIMKKLPAEERIKLEAHADGVRAIENRLDKIVACSPPAIGPDSGAGYPNYDLASRAHIDNIAMALACDLTRVVSLQFGAGNAGDSPTGLNHHDASHDAADFHDPDVLRGMADVDVAYAETIAYLLERLDAVPEGDGTMLDNTLVVWSSEIANSVTIAQPGGTHLAWRMPFMMAGGGNFAFETGRYLRYAQPENPDEPSGDIATAYELNHQRVLVSIGRAFGVTDASGDPLSSYGDMDPGSGPAPRL